jgi:hypothetical protein
MMVAGVSYGSKTVPSQCLISPTSTHLRHRGRYNVERLIAKHSDAKILFLLSDLANCPKTHSAGIYDRCKAKYEGLMTR